MRSVLLIIALPFAIGLIYRWLILPIKLKGKNAQSILSPREPTHPESLSPEMRQFLGNGVQQFRELGFETLSNDTMANSVPNVQGVEVLMVNRLTEEIAVLIAIWTKTNRSLVLGVRTNFADGTSIVTSARRSPQLFPKNPLIDSMSFPWVEDGSTLCEAHRRRVMNSGRAGEVKLLPDAASIAEYHDQQRDQSLDWMVRCGYRWRDEKAGVMRQTWKGAFLSAWKIMYPVKGWLTRINERNARRAWRALNMDDWRPATASHDLISANVTPVPAESRSTDTSPASLKYEPHAQAGEARREFLEGSVVLRGGAIRVKKFVRVHLLDFAVSGFLAFVMCNIAFTEWELWRFSRMYPKLAMPFRGPPPIGYVCIALLIFDLWRLASAWLRSRRSPVIQASEEMLSFENAPSRTRRGQISRRSIDSFQIRVDQVGLGAKIFRLQVITHGSTFAQPLVLSDDIAELQKFKSAISAAMGMHAESNMASSHPE